MLCLIYGTWERRLTPTSLFIFSRHRLNLKHASYCWVNTVIYFTMKPYQNLMYGYLTDLIIYEINHYNKLLSHVGLTHFHTV